MIFNELFGKYLVAKRVLKPNIVKEYYTRSELNASPLFTELSKDSILSEEDIYRHLGKFLGVEFRVCQLTELDLDLINTLPREKLIELQMLPFTKEDDTLVFLASNPFRFEEANSFRFNGINNIKFILVTNSSMTRMLEYVDNKVQQNSVLSDFSSKDVDITDVDSNEVNVDAPVIKLCDSLLKEAISRGASDIHIEPFEEKIVIRFRIDGKLNKMDEIPLHMYPAILARYKIMAELNIAERRVPQDGKINLTINNLDYDFRVSTIPTINGEKIVIRIYNISFSNNDMSAIGFSDKQQDLIKEMITRPHGILLLTGPTGSGKSTTLYTFLRFLNKEDTNIITVEDPVENVIEGINQVQVNPKANLTFATALRSILRQDPNIIMVGEIRDEETAQIATRAAITGHLVLSTIHTNDAAGVVTRLINMGIPRYLVADSLLGAISQRLVRKLCPKCRKRKKTSLAEMEMLGLSEPQTIYEAKGCPYCNHTGYFGRIGVFEIMVMDEELRNIVMSIDFTSEKLNNALSLKMQSILENTKERVLAGETTVEEYEQLSEVVSVQEKKY